MFTMTFRLALGFVVAAACRGAPTSTKLQPARTQTPTAPATIVLEGICNEEDTPTVALDADTTIGVIGCRGGEHASEHDHAFRVSDITYYLVRKRGAAIVAQVPLGTWESGPEWGGYAELEGLLHAGPHSVVAVVMIGEHTSPDTGATHVVVYQPDGDTFTSIYDRSGSVVVEGDHATVSDCIPSPHVSPPGLCERYENEEPRSTVLRWTGSQIVESVLPTP
jgi:hypothetical protein